MPAPISGVLLAAAAVSRKVTILSEAAWCESAPAIVAVCMKRDAQKLRKLKGPGHSACTRRLAGHLNGRDMKKADDKIVIKREELLWMNNFDSISNRKESTRRQSNHSAQ